jgi:hypothetical protein
VLAFVLVATPHARCFVKFTREDQEIKRATSHATRGVIWVYKYEPLDSYCCRLASPWAVLVYSCRLESPRSLSLCCCRLASPRAAVDKSYRHLPHVRPQSQVEVSEPITPSDSSYAKSAKSTAPRQDQDGRTWRSGPGGQENHDAPRRYDREALDHEVEGTTPRPRPRD